MIPNEEALYDFSEVTDDAAIRMTVLDGINRLAELDGCSMTDEIADLATSAALLIFDWI